MTQLRNTLQDVVRLALGQGPEADGVIAGSALDALPLDRPQAIHGSYRRLDQSLEQAHVDGMFRVAGALAAALTEPSRLGRVVGDCAVDDEPANDADCLERFLRGFGARVLRRPLEPDDLAFYREVYGTDSRSSSAGYADVIHVLLSAPDFLYFVEHGARELGRQPSVLEVSDFELASRLSYHFLQTLPDAELWGAAQDGSLHTPAGYASQVQRLAADPRARAAMLEFYADWLEVENLPQLGQSQDALYTAFAQPNTVRPELRQHMIDDVLDMLTYYTWTQPAGLEELFTSPLSFARDPELAAIYGSSAWDGVSTPPLAPPGQRHGLLTRALLLATGSANTRPIMKGVFIRRRLLCDDLPPPPAGVNAVVPELRPDMTTREAVEELTEQPGSPCAGCHATLINPLGFATETYDALGRFRTEQRLFAADGTLAGSLPVDTQCVPQITPGDAQSASGARDLAEIMLQSGKLETCLARNYLRFTLGRWEDDSRDACLIERLRATLAHGGLGRFLQEIALAPEFRQRSFME